MDDIIQSPLFWIGFCQWLVFTPLGIFCQRVLVPKLRLPYEIILEISILLILIGLVLYMPLRLTGNFPIPAGLAFLAYQYGFFSGGVLSIPFSAYLRRYFLEKTNGT